MVHFLIVDIYKVGTGSNGFDAVMLSWHTYPAYKSLEL